MKNAQLNKKYHLAIKEIVKVRNQRRLIYGDGFEEIGIVGNGWHIVNKVGRLRFMLENGMNSYESLKDTLIDIINYSLFCLAMVKEKEE